MVAVDKSYRYIMFSVILLTKLEQGIYSLTDATKGATPEYFFVIRKQIGLLTF